MVSRRARGETQRGCSVIKLSTACGPRVEIEARLNFDGGTTMQPLKCLFVGALTITSCLFAVRAEILSYEFRGTVKELSDGAAFFGTPAIGADFELTYLADFSVGFRNGGGGGFAGGNWLDGGSSFPADPYTPTRQISPVSAVLLVNGQELDFSGAYFGSVDYGYNGYNVPFGGYGTSGASFVAESRSGPDESLLSRISTGLHSPYTVDTFRGSIDELRSLVIDGNVITGSSSFSYLWRAGTSAETVISGSLTPTSYTVTVVSAIPEPSTWVLLAFGLTGTAVVLRVRPDIDGKADPDSRAARRRWPSGPLWLPSIRESRKRLMYWVASLVSLPRWH